MGNCNFVATSAMKKKAPGCYIWPIGDEILPPQGSNHLLRMVMEPEYYSEEVIRHPNHQLRI